MRTRIIAIIALLAFTAACDSESAFKERASEDVNEQIEQQMRAQLNPGVIIGCKVVSIVASEEGKRYEGLTRCILLDKNTNETATITRHYYVIRDDDTYQWVAPEN